MVSDVWRPAHLTPKQMEERRLVAATLLRQRRLSREFGPITRRPEMIVNFVRHAGLSVTGLT